MKFLIQTLGEVIMMNKKKYLVVASLVDALFVLPILYFLLHLNFPIAFVGLVVYAAVFLAFKKIVRNKLNQNF